MNQISLCITNYNRFAYLFKSFEQVLNDERIGEVVIVDDCSNSDMFSAISERCKYIPKVKLFRNPVNLGCYANKHQSVGHATNEYCIVFDSDNVISTDYLDKVYSVEWDKDTILAPDFAKPVFDYRRFSGITFNHTNVSQYANIPAFDCLINTMNYFVNRDSYLSVYKPKQDIKGADSIYLNYLWLLSNKSIHVLNGLHYYHRVEHLKSEQMSNYVTYAKDSELMCANLLTQIYLMK